MKRERKNIPFEKTQARVEMSGNCLTILPRQLTRSAITGVKLFDSHTGRPC